MTTKKKPGSLFAPPAPAAEPAAPDPTGAPKRGKHLISGLFEPAAYRQFGVLSAELGLAKGDLLREALNDLFMKHGKPPIA